MKNQLSHDVTSSSAPSMSARRSRALTAIRGALALATLALLALAAPRTVRADSIVSFKMTVTYNGVSTCGAAGTSPCSQTSTVSFRWDNTTNSYVNGTAMVTGSGILGPMTLSTPPTYGVQNGGPIVYLNASDAEGDQFSFVIGESAGGLAPGPYTTIVTAPSIIPAMAVEAGLSCAAIGDTCEFDYSGSASGVSPGFQIATFGTGSGSAELVLPKPPTHWLAFNQILQFIVAGPITPAPGAPVEATVSFLDLNGAAIGPAPQPLTINPGQFVSVQFAANDYIKTVGPRIAVRPVLTVLPNPNAVSGAPTVDVQASSEVFDAIAGFGTLFGRVPLWPPDPCFPPDPCSTASSLVPQGLAGGQSLRITAVAYPPDPCFATLGFADQNGNPVGGSVPVSLQPGTGTFFDLNASALGLAAGQRTEILPVVTLTPPLSAFAGPASPSTCQVSVEAFNHVTGRTTTYQSAVLR